MEDFTSAIGILIWMADKNKGREIRALLHA